MRTPPISQATGPASTAYRSQVRISTWDGLLFDLDGVLTPTAEVHRAAWKRTFDAFLRSRSIEAEFTTDDYLRWVDGKPRYDGVRDFLASRGIRIPEGNPSDAPSWDTVCAVGNAKNDAFREVLVSDGVTPFPGSVALLDHLAANDVAVAVVSSSANARSVLEAAGLRDRFSVVIDGLVARERGLPGKPAPDTYLAGAADLGTAPDRTVVVEDAISGVEAGAAGHFGLVVGVDREGIAEEMRAAGADLVVDDLARLIPTD